MSARIPPPLVLLLCAALMWALDRGFESARLAFMLQPWLAGLLAVSALALMVLAVVAMLGARTTVDPLRPEKASSLVTSGVFAVSRNPIYLGDLLLLLAWAVWLGNVAALLPLPAFVWFIRRFQILPEERALAAKFGQPYREYCRRVRRWL